jgi:hypothetical protein
MADPTVAEQAIAASVSLLGVAGTAAVGVIVPAVLRRLHIAGQAEDAARVESAVNAWLGYAIRVGVRIAAEKLAEKMPDRLARLGIDVNHLEDMFAARQDTLAVTGSIPGPVKIADGKEAAL